MYETYYYWQRARMSRPSGRAAASGVEAAETPRRTSVDSTGSNTDPSRLLTTHAEWSPIHDFCLASPAF